MANDDVGWSRSLSRRNTTKQERKGVGKVREGSFSGERAGEAKNSRDLGSVRTFAVFPARQIEFSAAALSPGGTSEKSTAFRLGPLRFSSDNPQHHRRRPQPPPPTNNPAINSKWVTPLVFVRALAYVVFHQRNPSRTNRLLEGLGLLLQDDEVLTVGRNLVCLLAGLPQEGYDCPGNLPEAVQVRRNSKTLASWRQKRHF